MLAMTRVLPEACASVIELSNEPTSKPSLQTAGCGRRHLDGVIVIVIARGCQLRECESASSPSRPGGGHADREGNVGLFGQPGWSYLCVLTNCRQHDERGALRQTLLPVTQGANGLKGPKATRRLGRARHSTLLRSRHSALLCFLAITHVSLLRSLLIRCLLDKFLRQWLSLSRPRVDITTRWHPPRCPSSQPNNSI